MDNVPLESVPGYPAYVNDIGIDYLYAILTFHEWSKSESGVESGGLHIWSPNFGALLSVHVTQVIRLNI